MFQIRLWLTVGMWAPMQGRYMTDQWRHAPFQPSVREISELPKTYVYFHINLLAMRKSSNGL